MAVPPLIGKVLDASNPALVEAVKSGAMNAETAVVSYDYTNPLLMLAFLGVAALVLGMVLKVIDRRQHLGLELPNVKDETAKTEEAEAEAVEI